MLIRLAHSAREYDYRLTGEQPIAEILRSVRTLTRAPANDVVPLDPVSSSLGLYYYPPGRACPRSLLFQKP